VISMQKLMNSGNSLDIQDVLIAGIVISNKEELVYSVTAGPFIYDLSFIHRLDIFIAVSRSIILMIFLIGLK
jgi:hypothetical protein